VEKKFSNQIKMEYPPVLYAAVARWQRRRQINRNFGLAMGGNTLSSS